MNMVAVFDEIIRRKPAASEWLAWACLMRQTLCFGKAEDDLADSRLEKLAGLRRDHARAAVRKVVGMGLFDNAGQGKYGTVYRVPERFWDGSSYIGFSANMGASETDAYAEITVDKTDEAGTVAPEHGEAYQHLVETNRMLVEANQVLVNTNQGLVETNRILVNALPTLGGQLTKTGSNAYQELVTDSNKPKHNKTTTTLNPDSGEEAEDAQERWPEHWGQAGQGLDGFQAWGEYAAMAAPQAAAGQPIPASQTKTSGITAEALQYPAGLSAAERAKAPGKLDGLHPQIAQEVLDALAWKMADGSVKTPIGLLVYMANKAREGTFDRTPALEWRKGQQMAQAKQEGLTLVELNNLAIDIKETQRLHRESGHEVFFKQAETMKATYFQKLEVYKIAQATLATAHGQAP
jgi:hypothetical protein